MELIKYSVFGQIIETNLKFDEILPTSEANVNVYLIERKIVENTLNLPEFGEKALKRNTIK